MRGLFITGTGTEVGKTYVAALIAKALVRNGRRVGVYKPVASGCVDDAGALVAEDAVALWHAAGQPRKLDRVCPQRFAAPVAPPVAAREVGSQVDSQLLRSGLEYWRDHCDIVLVEGAGGLMSPLSDDDFCADLAIDFGFPLVVVAANELGTINSTLQTLITAATFRDGLDVAGVVLNQLAQRSDDSSLPTNSDELARRCVAPLLAEVEPHGDFQPPVDWWDLATDGKP